MERFERRSTRTASLWWCGCEATWGRGKRGAYLLELCEVPGVVFTWQVTWIVGRGDVRDALWVYANMAFGIHKGHYVTSSLLPMPRIRKSASIAARSVQRISSVYCRDIQARDDSPARENKTQGHRTPQKDQETGPQGQGCRKACVALGVNSRLSLIVARSRATQVEKGSGHPKQLSL